MHQQGVFSFCFSFSVFLSVYFFPARRSLPPSRLRREGRPVLPKLSLERMEPRTPPSSPRPWDSPNARYMSPTTSSRAKISRCVSAGDGLHLGSSETLPISSPFTSAPAELKHLKPRACQRLSSPFDEWPSRSSSPLDPGSSGAVTSDVERPRAAVKAFSVTSDDQGSASSSSVSLPSSRTRRITFMCSTDAFIQNNLRYP